MISLRPSQMIGKMQLTSLHRNGEALTTKATIFSYATPHFKTLFSDSWRGKMRTHGSGLNFPDLDGTKLAM